MGSPRLLSTLFLAVLSLCSVGIHGELATNEIIELLTLHNEARAEVCITVPLEWDPIIASVAQTYASTCAAVPNPNRNAEYIALGGNTTLGENYGSGVAAIGIAQIWINEKNGWECGQGFETAGRYTQIVWQNSTRFGCGSATCVGYNNLVCNYAPAGNIAEEFPFPISLEACSKSCNGTFIPPTEIPPSYVPPTSSSTEDPTTQVIPTTDEELESSDDVIIFGFNLMMTSIIGGGALLVIILIVVIIVVIVVVVKKKRSNRDSYDYGNSGDTQTNGAIPVLSMAEIQNRMNVEFDQPEPQGYNQGGGW